MSTEVSKQPVKLPALLESEGVKKRLNEILGKRASTFASSVIQIAKSNALLANAEPTSILNAAIVSATLDLPLNNSLGFAYIVPFKNNKTGVVEAQFQLGYKGFIQLALRSGQFQNLSSTPIYEGQLVSENPLTGFEFDFSKKTSNKIVGYAGYFKLINGFEKTLYASVEEITAHGKKYSQTFKKGFGMWKDDFDAMAQKTIIKMLLSKYAPLSIDMQRAVVLDQAVINDTDNIEDIGYTYADNDRETFDDVAQSKERERIIAYINGCNSIEELNAVGEDVLSDEAINEAYQSKLNSLA